MDEPLWEWQKNVLSHLSQPRQLLILLEPAVKRTDLLILQILTTLRLVQLSFNINLIFILRPSILYVMERLEFIQFGIYTFKAAEQPNCHLGF